LHYVSTRGTAPVLPFEAGPLASVASGIGIPHVPDGMLGRLLFGNAIDTTKLGSAGFHPEHDLVECLEAFARE